MGKIGLVSLETLAETARLSEEVHLLQLKERKLDLEWRIKEHTRNKRLQSFEPYLLLISMAVAAVLGAGAVAAGIGFAHWMQIR